MSSGRAITGMAVSAPAAPRGNSAGFGSRRPGLLDRAVWRIADSRRLGPLARARLRLAAARIAPGPFDIEAEGIRLRAWPAENHSDRVAMARGRLPDRDERAAIAPYLDSGGTFVDVGANIGVYAIWAAGRVGPSGRVVALEPHPRTAERLAFNVAANGLANIRIVRKAAGEEASTASLHDSAGGNVGQSSLIEDVAFRPERSFDVRVRPLLDILTENGIDAIDALKIDIEGYEDRALVPFLRTAPHGLLPRAVLLETDVADMWATDCLAALREHGYDLKARTVANAVFVRKTDRNEPV